MQTPTLTAGKRVSPKNDFAKKAANEPAEQKKFDDDEDFDDDFDDESLNDLDYDGAGSYDDEDDDF
ncbi:hypothetical protein [Mucilaginibacter aquatilis]|uniref:Uncharacterized protein n=1 Tax=Mucilaginibacter aquatilis TaxID=1517760 RepID=A0A6I4I5U0_9SPHI|nr:hypothetical protein [Mucilaginibacter aquatilis]MVN89518.1 hypothetical protein [Mucilaginibacter aquatilis]